MSKGRLTFDLPTEQTEFIAAAKSGELVGALHEYLEWLRGQIKYSEERPTLEEVRAKLWELLTERGVTELLS